MVPYLENTVAQGSVLTILAISIERYRVVCHPLKGVNENYKKVWKSVVIIWIISAIASVPSLYMAVYKDSRYIDGTPIKVCRSYLYLDWHRAYIVMLCFIFFVLPSSILLGLYCKVCYVLHVARKESLRLGQTNKYKDKKRLKRQVINILTSIVLLFFVCHLPYRILGLWTAFDTAKKLMSLGFETYYNILYSCRIMFYLNHAVNPIIYNFVSTKFRNAMKCMCTGQARYGSFTSSHHQRQINEHSPCVRRKQHEVLIANKEFSNTGVNDTTKTIDLEPESAKQKQRRNEFFPMYASIIEDSSKEENLSGNQSNKCELQIKLVNKDVNMCINYTNRRRSDNTNCFHMV